MKQRLAIYLFTGFVLCTVAVAAFHEEPYIFRHDEPAVFDGIGPQDERADNPVAAAVVAAGLLAVSTFIYLLYHSEEYEWMQPFDRYFQYEDLDDKIEGTET